MKGQNHGKRAMEYLASYTDRYNGIDVLKHDTEVGFKIPPKI